MAVLGFIGMGNMGSAMLSGAKETFGKENIIFHRNSREKMVEFSKKEEVDYCESNNEVVKKAKYIILAVNHKCLKRLQRKLHRT